MSLRIALLVDSCTVPHSVRDLVDWAEAEPEIEICALIIHPAPQTTTKGLRKFFEIGRKQGLYTALSRTAFALLVKIEGAVFMRAAFNRERLAFYPIGARVQTHIVTKPEVSTSGFVYRFSDEDVERVRALDADLLIRCGNGILKGPILSVAKHGVISVHHGDNRMNRGGPAGFWEVLERQPYTGFIVQRLTDELDGGEVLCRGNITTDILYLRNQTILYERSGVYLKKTIRNILTGDVKPEAPLLYDNRLYKTPLALDSMRYGLKTAGMLARKAIRKALGIRWQWGVGYLFGDWSNAVLWRAKTIANPPGHFLADPFAFEHEGEHFIFLEDFVYSEQKGVVSVYRVTTTRSEYLGVAVSESFHLSFPFVFRFEGGIYMVPESSTNRDMRLYKATDFPLEWELVDILMSDISAVDTIIFPKDGRWHLLTTINPTQVGSNDAELCLFSSDTPLGGWQPHPSNPVVMDASKGRNAGLVRRGTEIYRLAQRHGFAQYGKGTTIYRVDDLETYSETKIQDIDPNFLPGIKGTHHLHHDRGLTVFDYVRNMKPD